MLRKLPLYLVMLLLTQCSKCKLDAPKPQSPKDPLSILPPETQTGANSFGCLVNGKAYVALYTTNAHGDWQSLNKLALGATMVLNGDGAGEYITLLPALNGKLQDNQTFDIISSATPFPIFTPGINQFYTHVAAIPCFYEGDYFKSGRVELVKFDGVRRIAAGRFAFTLYQPGGCDTLHVTNGRFDVKF